MLHRLLRTVPVVRTAQARRIHVPFQDDLTPVDDELFNLDGFQDYKELPDVLAHKKRMGLGSDEEPVERKPEPIKEQLLASSFVEATRKKQPLVFVSRLTNPYLNLAIEDYVYHNMPVPAAGEANCNRLMFYVNLPCVVIGKNQNPWREVNMPLLSSLRLPMVRRRSGGGTVVHDTGNVNYSFMTTKEAFDRQAFARVVCESTNKIAQEDKQIMVTERGDIVTIKDQLKVSGSAYKLTKGRLYHHGTMLLNLKLDVLRQLLHREELLGSIASLASVESVKLPVTNLHLDKEEFVEAVSSGFRDAYGIVEEAKEKEPEEMNENEFLGLQDFVNAFSERQCETFVVDEDTELPEEIEAMRNELTLWEWKFGSTAKFTHRFEKKERGLVVEFEVVKGRLQSMSISGEDKDIEAMEFLQTMLEREGVPYTGSDVAGFITDDELSEWLGNAIDGLS